MAIVKVIELISEGESIEAAMQNAINEASKTVKGIKQINVVHIEAHVENNKIHKYRVNSNISFEIMH